MQVLIHRITYHKLFFFYRYLKEILDEMNWVVSFKLVIAMKNAEENMTNLYILQKELDKVEKTRDEVNKTISFAFLFLLMLLVFILNLIF